jgi:hypothetical protein
MTMTMIACGEPVVDEQWRGEPLGQFEWLLQFEQDRPFDLPGAVRAAVFWAPGGIADEGRWVEQVQTGRAVLQVPAVFTLNVFDRPPESAFEHGASYAVGRVRVYDDADENGRWTDGEAWLGEALGGLLFVPEALTAGASFTGRPLEAGLHGVVLPMPCRAPVTEASVACEVVLGGACGPRISCGAGAVCVSDELGTPWPGGTCAVRDDAQACHPPGAGFVRSARDGQGYWILGCETDADCALEGSVGCDVAVRGCLPVFDTRVVLRLEPRAVAWCAPG